jgi:hypothetical protein
MGATLEAVVSEPTINLYGKLLDAALDIGYLQKAASNIGFY